jgi:pyrrolysine biosynthesis protein PylD
MTRLQSIDIGGISDSLNSYDEKLLAKTGRTLRGITCYAAGLEEKEFLEKSTHILIAVIPIQWGRGVIGGFCKTTSDILRHIGFRSFVTEKFNISGMAEALEKQADIVFMADDNRFVALNLVYHRVVDNAAATGKGFVAGLDLMTGGLQGQKALVIGCGPVGLNAALTLINYGARVSVYDINRARTIDAARILQPKLETEVGLPTDLSRALSKHQILVEASNSADIIHEKDLSDITYIAAPGMPLGVSNAAQEKIADRLLHDPLQIGVATMGVEAIKPTPRESEGSSKNRLRC